MVDFCYDTLGEYNIGYPNLARVDIDPSEFDTTWPRTVPWRALMYFREAGIECQTHTVESAPDGSFYPVAFAWFDHACDYFDLMSKQLHQRLRNRTVQVLFYYHEGDSPFTIKQTLDQRCRDHELPVDCYQFVSANSAASSIPGFVYFDDHMHFFKYLNRFQSAESVQAGERPYEFTALNRTHKWWRAACMTDLHRTGILDNSLWSYNTEFDWIEDDPNDNPIQLGAIPGLAPAIEQFLQQGPYWCDSDNQEQHNDHSGVNTDLYTQSYCHIVIETLFDTNGSGGAFITEKTYKAIKYGQPFVIVGAPGSLQILREQGYRVFDHAINNHYDEIEHNTKRWTAIRRLLSELKQKDLQEWHSSCIEDIRHNQMLFQSSAQSSLQKLLKDLNIKEHYE